MSSYIDVIKIAVACFPLIALLISLPFMVIQYHKYGSISFWKACIVYTFILYLTCAYFLVIMPLPKISEVAAMTSPRTQLIPFKFVSDFFTHTSLNPLDVQTYWPALTQSYCFVPIYNILLLLPFGIYLRYYFKCDFKTTVLWTFLLSLFFELTQLSGLCFIYPRGYRLFDVDDLILNTAGGMLGYVVAGALIKVLPKREQIDASAKERGKTVSGVRRSLAFLLDLVICLAALAFVHQQLPGIIIVIIYYFVLPILLHGSTPMERLLKLRVVDEDGTENILLLWLRRVLFIVFYLLLPQLVIFGLASLIIESELKETVIFCLAMIIMAFYVITFLKFLFTKKSMLYEKLSKTRLVSTIVI